MTSHHIDKTNPNNLAQEADHDKQTHSPDETNTQDWLAYLTSQGAMIQDDTVMSFGDSEAELAATHDGAIMCDLSHLGLLEISGADAFSFLQGQVTNDVFLLAGNTSHYSGYCNAKGRLLALFLAFSHYNHLHLQFNRELVAPIMKRLKMYVMRSKVDIQDSTASIIKLGLNSEHAVSLLEKLFTEVPKNPHELVSLANGALLCLPSSKPNQSRYEIFTSAKHAATIWNALKLHCKPVGKNCWDLLEIEAGIPEIVTKTQEEFVPQMLNLDVMQAINFKKGCYTGQEIVARTHYLGKVKRRTLQAQLTSSHLPEAGDDILNVSQEAVGKVVRSAFKQASLVRLLVELRLENLTNADTSLSWQGLSLTMMQSNEHLTNN